MKRFPIELAKSRNRANGRHFFSPDTMRFFNSRTSTYCKGDDEAGVLYFVTSEQGDSLPRKYTARAMRPNGVVDDIGKFQAFDSARQAWRAIEEL